MTKREIVKRAIRFDCPERLPISFPSQNDDDICPLNYNETDNQPFCAGKDEWGCVWRTFDTTIGNVCVHPLDRWEALRDYPFPNPNTPNRFDDAARTLSSGVYRDHYLMGSVNFTLFERMHFLRGFNELLVDLHLYRDRVLELAEIVTSFQVEIVKGWAKLGVDGLTFSDDWGTQKGLIIDPLDWKAIFLPFYTRIFYTAHQHGLDVFFHSDGQIFHLIPYLMQSGVDALEIPQPRLLDIEKTAKAFAGRLAFYGCVDKQKTMVYGSSNQIEQEVLLLLKSFASKQGGFIAREPGGGYFSDYRALEIEPQKVQFVYRLFKRESERFCR